MNDFIPYSYYSKERPKPPPYVKEPKEINKGILPESLPLFTDYSEIVQGSRVTFHDCPVRTRQNEYGDWIIVIHAEECSIVTWT